MDNDIIMRQIKMIGEGIGLVLKKKVSSETLGEIQREDGSYVSRMDLVLAKIENHQIKEAFTLVNCLKYKMSAYEFQGVSSWFMEVLTKYSEDYPNLLSRDKLQHYEELINDIL